MVGAGAVEHRSRLIRDPAFDFHDDKEGMPRTLFVGQTARSLRRLRQVEPAMVATGRELSRHRFGCARLGCRINTYDDDAAARQFCGERISASNR
jgi:hypothetical protein